MQPKMLDFKWKVKVKVNYFILDGILSRKYVHK